MSWLLQNTSLYLVNDANLIVIEIEINPLCEIDLGKTETAFTNAMFWVIRISLNLADSMKELWFQKEGSFMQASTQKTSI